MQNKLNILCVTNKNAVKGDFLKHIENLLKGNVYALILREKELSANEFKKLALDVNALCMQYKTSLFLNAHFADFKEYTLALANELGCNLHTSFENYKLIIRENLTKEFSSSITLGISIHSIQEAEFIKINYEQCPVQHVIAGHIFNTDCKRGTAGRGLDFLKNITTCMHRKPKIPVFAIGGMTPERVPDVLKTNVHGIAVMSSLMQTKNPLEVLQAFQTTAHITSFQFGRLI